MAKLITYLHGKIVSEVSLEANKTYIIGRDKSADVRLDSISGISRQHVKIHREGEHWLLSVLSQFGNVLYEGQLIDEMLLDVSLSFKIPPYDIQFVSETKEFTKQTVTSDLPQNTKANPLDLPDSDFNHGTSPEDKVSKSLVQADTRKVNTQLPQKTAQEIAIQSFSDEITSSGVFDNIVGIIKWRDSNGKKKGYKFSQGSCVVGRGENCEVSIPNSLLSRRHFEITKEKNHFFIVDLGSANGTKLNNKEVSKNQPISIESGDKISISGFMFSFQIKDEQFEKKLSTVPILQQSSLDLMPPPPIEAGARVVRVDKNQRQIISEPADKKLKIRLALIAAIVILIGFLIFDADPPAETGKADQASANTITFEKLTPEEKSIVMDAFKLGKNHFNQKKYANCAKEFEKLHKILPFYMNSKEIAGLCEQTLALEKENSEIERKRKEQILMEQRIKAIVEDCRHQLPNFKNTNEANECITPAISMFPDHPAIIDYQNTVAIREQQERDEASRRSRRLAQIKKGESLFLEAKQEFEKQRFRKAMDKYSEFIGSSYPDPNGYRSIASRDLAVAKQKLSEKVQVNFDECKKFYNERRFKESVISCDKALEEDPKNSEVKSYRKLIVSELRKEMKTIYQDAILEESLGNVDAAKEKWKKILELDIETDEFYIKSKSKLKKYGIGI